MKVLVFTSICQSCDQSPSIVLSNPAEEDCSQAQDGHLNAGTVMCAR